MDHGNSSLHGQCEMVHPVALQLLHDFTVPGSCFPSTFRRHTAGLCRLGGVFPEHGSGSAFTAPLQLDASWFVSPLHHFSQPSYFTAKRYGLGQLSDRLNLTILN